MSGKETTLCYIFRGEQCLLLHRNKKEQDVNQGKWVGVGGKLEEGETPQQCLMREVKEETGLVLTEYQYRGVVTFVSDVWDEDCMHLFTATSFEGEVTSCEEGTLAWKPFDDIFTLPRWEGDDVFLKLLQKNQPFFRLKLVYQGETLVESTLDGVPLGK